LNHSHFTDGETDPAAKAAAACLRTHCTCETTAFLCTCIQAT